MVRLLIVALCGLLSCSPAVTFDIAENLNGVDLSTSNAQSSQFKLSSQVDLKKRGLRYQDINLFRLKQIFLQISQPGNSGQDLTGFNTIDLYANVADGSQIHLAQVGPFQPGQRAILFDVLDNENLLHVLQGQTLYLTWVVAFQNASQNKLVDIELVWHLKASVTRSNILY